MIKKPDRQHIKQSKPVGSQRQSGAPKGGAESRAPKGPDKEDISRRLASFPLLNPNPVIEIDSSRKITFCNPAALETLESLGMDKGDVDAFLPPDIDAILGEWDKRNETTLYREIVIKDRIFGETLQLVPQFDAARIYAADITDHKKDQWERETAAAFLRLVNESRNTLELVQAATAFFQERASVEAVGIRLPDEHDYPYYESRGFPAEFVRAESRLCTCDKDGQPILDSTGNPVLECMCGNVICGRFDPSKPFFTKRGNFWTNSTTKLLAGTTEKDRQARTRNRCHGEGYESVALFGLTLGDERLGLLQMNDRQKGRFTPESLALWERLADYLAIALAKFRTDDKLQKSAEQFRTLADSIPNLAWWANGDGYITWYNRRWYEYTGTTPEQMEGWGWQSVHDPNVLPKVLERWKASIATGEPFDMELPLRGADGVFHPFLTRVQPLKDSAGLVLRWFGTNTDISALKQAEEVQGRLAAIVETAEDAIIGKDLNGVIQTWNVGAENIFGYKAGEVIGKPVALLVPPGHTDEVPEILVRIRQGEHIEKFETVRMRKDGTIVPVSLTFSSIRDKSGEVIGASKVAHDITERKEAEKALKKAHDELELKVLQRTSELSLTNENLIVQLEKLKRAEDRISRLNRLYSVLSKVNETIVRTYDSDELLDRVCRIAVEDGLFKMAWIGLIDPDSRIVKPTASYGDTDGYLTGVKVYAADVPEGKGPTGTAAFEGKYSIAGDIENDPRMLPWREKARRHGLNSSAAFPIHAGSSVIGALTVYSGKSHFFTDEEIQLLTSLAEDVSFAIDSITNEKKRLAAEESLRIINEELEQRIAVRTADLEAANKELEAFSYSVSHDLRAPLRHMSGFVELLQKRLGGHADEKIRDYAATINEASKKMGMLIDDLLNFSRLGRSAMQKRRVNLNALASEVIREIQEELKGRDIIWEIDQLPHVLADQSLLRLVFVNLISNAVKFTSTCPQAEIKIGCKDEGDKFTCSVKDNGVGFDMKYVNKIFGVFQRLHTQDEFEGTGIGLANVQRIIARHGGRIWAEGAVGQGAAFYFTLPKIKEP